MLQVNSVRAARKSCQPAEQFPAETWFNVEGAIILEQPSSGLGQHTRHGQWQAMTGGNQAAIAIRATRADLMVALNKRYRYTALRKILGASSADNSAANDEYVGV